MDRVSVFSSSVGRKEDSDMDILVEFEGEKGLLDLAKSETDLEEFLGRKLDVLASNG